MTSKGAIKIGIVGGGNIGRLISVLLLSAGYDVEMSCSTRHKAVKIDNSYAFEIKGDFGDKSYLVPVVHNIDDFSCKKDIIIFTTRRDQMLGQVNTCLHKLKPTGLIATIQNIYSIDKLITLIPPESSVCLVCDFGCRTINKITYAKDSNGITLGVYNKKAINRMKLLGRVLSSVFKVSTTRDIVAFTMGRNIINGAISVLGGISGLNLSELLGCKEGRYLFTRSICEVYNICVKHNINVTPYNYQLDYAKFSDKSISGIFYRKNILRLLKNNNGNIKSSALYDLEHGERPEIRGLVDTIIAYSNDISVCNETVTVLSDILREIEKGERSISIDNLKDAYTALKLKK
ncbi:MAG: hypothetical protein E7356_04475 [Clostridiales bacterium]|nr:hypothetical protein [Clostridiales bacterium]